MKVLLINPSKNFYKKEVDQSFKANQLNFGILAIASRFPENIFIYDCQSKEYRNAINDILYIISEKNIRVVGISLISAYSEKSAFDIAEEISLKFKDMTIIYGGKDHAAYIAEDLIDYHHAKAVVKSYGEEFFSKIIDGVDLYKCPSIIYKNDIGKIVETECVSSKTTLSLYDHTLYPDYLNFVPSIEVSRGCHKNCIFCSNNSIKPVKKDIKIIINEINKIKKIYGESICAYFQTPHFLFPKKDLEMLAKYREKNDQFIWRTQTGVRYLNAENIKLLYEAGARVIDVGFESASTRILNHMSKDENPDEYLVLMKNALKSAAEVGLRLKLNILLFAGETKESITQTSLFLKDNLYNFHSFSAYPVMVYPSPGSRKFIAKINELGGTVVEMSMSKNIHYVNLSPQIDYKKANKIALLLGKSFQNSEMYMSQKYMGYLPCGQRFDNAKLDHEKLPFYSSMKDQAQSYLELSEIIKELI